MHGEIMPPRTLANISSIQATTRDKPKDISLSSYQVTILNFQYLKKGPHFFHWWHIKRYI